MALGLVLNRRSQVPAEHSPAFGAIAERFRRAGDLDRAVGLCEEGLLKFPEHLSARVTLGWALLDLGRYNEARAELERVIKRAPDNLAAIRGLAELHDRTENADASDMQGRNSWAQAETVQAPEALEPRVIALEATAAAPSPGPRPEPAPKHPYPLPAAAVPKPTPQPVAVLSAQPEPEFELTPPEATEELTDEQAVLPFVARSAPAAEVAEAAGEDAPVGDFVLEVARTPVFEQQLDQFVRAVAPPVAKDPKATPAVAALERFLRRVETRKIERLAQSVAS